MKILLQGINQAISEALGEKYAKEAYYADFSYKDGSISAPPLISPASTTQIPAAVSSLANLKILGNYSSKRVINNQEVDFQAILYSYLDGATGKNMLGISVYPYIDANGNLVQDWKNFLFKSVSYTLANTTQSQNAIKDLFVNRANYGFSGLNLGSLVNSIILFDSYTTGWASLKQAYPWITPASRLSAPASLWISMSSGNSSPSNYFPTNPVYVYHFPTSTSYGDVDVYVGIDFLWNDPNQTTGFGNLPVLQSSFLRANTAEYDLANAYYSALFPNGTVITFSSLHPRLDMTDADITGIQHVSGRIYSFGSYGLDFYPQANNSTYRRYEVNLYPTIFKDSDQSQINIADLNFSTNPNQTNDSNGSLDPLTQLVGLVGNYTNYGYAAYGATVYETLNGEFGFCQTNGAYYYSGSASQVSVRGRKVFMGFFDTLDDVKLSLQQPTAWALYPILGSLPSNTKRLHFYIALIPNSDFDYLGITTPSSSSDTSLFAANSNLDIPDDRFQRAFTYELSLLPSVPPSKSDDSPILYGYGQSSGSPTWVLYKSPAYAAKQQTPNGIAFAFNAYTQINGGDSLTALGITSKSIINPPISTIVRHNEKSYAIEPTTGVAYTNAVSAYGNSLNTFPEENFVQVSNNAMIYAIDGYQTLLFIAASNGIYVVDSDQLTTLNKFNLVATQPYHLVNTRYGMIILTNTGVFLSNGSDVEQIDLPINDIYKNAYPNVSAVALEAFNGLLVNISGHYYVYNFVFKRWSHYYYSADPINPLQVAINNNQITLYQGNSAYTISPTQRGVPNQKINPNAVFNGYVKSHFIPLNENVVLRQLFVRVKAGGFSGLSTKGISIGISPDTSKPIFLNLNLKPNQVNTFTFNLPPIPCRQFQLIICYLPINFEIEEINVVYEPTKAIIPYTLTESVRESMVDNFILNGQ